MKSNEIPFELSRHPSEIAFPQGFDWKKQERKDGRRRVLLLNPDNQQHRFIYVWLSERREILLNGLGADLLSRFDPGFGQKAAAELVDVIKKTEARITELQAEAKRKRRETALADANAALQNTDQSIEELERQTDEDSKAIEAAEFEAKKIERKVAAFQLKLTNDKNKLADLLEEQRQRDFERELAPALESIREFNELQKKAFEVGLRLKNKLQQLATISEGGRAKPSFPTLNSLYVSPPIEDTKRLLRIDRVPFLAWNAEERRCDVSIAKGGGDQ